MSPTALARTPASAERAHPAQTVTVRPARRREPPFDDELWPHPHAVGVLDQRLPFERDGRSSGPRPQLGDPFARDGLPDPAQWGRRLLVGLIETAGGRRPLQQLTALLSAGVASGIGADFERAAQRNTRHWTHAAVIRSVRATQPAEGVAELCATVQAGRRVRAVAFRLEARDGRWRCTRLQLG
jgi:hypothetical protein